MFFTGYPSIITLRVKNNTDNKISLISFYYKDNDNISPINLKNIKSLNVKQTGISTVNAGSRDLYMNLFDKTYLIKPAVETNNKSVLIITISKISDDDFGIDVKEEV